MTMNQKTKFFFGLAFIVLILLLLPKGLAAQEPQAVQTTPTRVRPTVVPGEEAVASIAGGGEVNTDNCASVQGAAIHWGVGNLGGVGVQLQDSGWQVQAETSDAGRYQFGALGVGIGTLTVNPGFTALRPMINEAAVRLRCDLTTYAHLGLYGGDQRPTPPGNITMQVSPETVMAGDTIDIELTIQNSLPNPISQVVITDLLPAGLMIEAVQTSAGQAEVLNGRFLTVDMESLAQGAQATITILARADATWENESTLTNRATLFYAESAADQAISKITIQPAAPTLDETIAANDPPDSTTPQESLATADNPSAETNPVDIPQPLALSDLDLPPTTLPVTGFVPDPIFSFPLGLLMALGLFIQGAASIKRRQK